MENKVRKTIAVLLVALPLTLAGCVGSQTSLNLEQQLNLIEKDLSGMFSSPKAQRPLSLSEAMARGVKFNLDKKLAEQEQQIADGEIDLSQLSVLPDLDLNASKFGRNSPGASSSRSVLSGQTSLEPSISAEQYRQTMTLDASWNIMDVAMGYVRTKQTSNKALIARERQRKVVHNIMQDIRYAYWRSVGYEMVESRSKTLQKRAQEAVRYLQTAESLNLEDSSQILQKQSRILESIHEMNRLKSELSFAKTELAALIDMPSSAGFSMQVEPYSDTAFLQLPQFTLGAGELEGMALILRPEMREEAYKQRIQDGAMRLAVLETFPGLELLTGVNYDSNQFLEDKRWVDFSVSLTDNLVKLFTLPARYELEKNKQRVGDLRRQALTAAVMTQTRISMARYQLAKNQFSLMKRINEVDQRMARKAEGQAYAEAISEPDLVLAEIRQLLSLTRTYLAYADLQNAYGRVINTIGLDPLPADVKSASLHEVKNVIEHRLANQDRIIEDLYWSIYDKSGGAIAPKAAVTASYGSLENYAASVYGSETGGMASPSGHAPYREAAISAAPSPQSYAYQEDVYPLIVAPLPRKKPFSGVQTAGAVRRYKGPSQPILDGDPAYSGQQAAYVAPRSVPASYSAPKAASSVHSGQKSCDTYYQIKRGCQN